MATYEAEKFMYRLRCYDKRLAWKVFRYFRAHQELLNQKDHLTIYENVKAASLRYMMKTDGSFTKAETEEAMVLFADVQNACEEFTYVPAQKELDHYLHYENFTNRLCAFAMLYGKNNIFIDTSM